MRQETRTWKRGLMSLSSLSNGINKFFLTGEKEWGKGWGKAGIPTAISVSSSKEDRIRRGVEEVYLWPEDALRNSVETGPVKADVRNAYKAELWVIWSVLLRYQFLPFGNLWWFLSCQHKVQPFFHAAKFLWLPRLLNSTPMEKMEALSNHCSSSWSLFHVVFCLPLYASFVGQKAATQKLAGNNPIMEIILKIWLKVMNCQWSDIGNKIINLIFSVKWQGDSGATSLLFRYHPASLSEKREFYGQFSVPFTHSSLIRSMADGFRMEYSSREGWWLQKWRESDAHSEFLVKGESYSQQQSEFHTCVPYRVRCRFCFSLWP